MKYKGWDITVVNRPELGYLNQVICVRGNEQLVKKFAGEVDMDIVRSKLDKYSV